MAYTDEDWWENAAYGDNPPERKVEITLFLTPWTEAKPREIFQKTVPVIRRSPLEKMPTMEAEFGFEARHVSKLKCLQGRYFGENAKHRKVFFAAAAGCHVLDDLQKRSSTFDPYPFESGHHIVMVLELLPMRSLPAVAQVSRCFCQAALKSSCIDVPLGLEEVGHKERGARLHVGFLRTDGSMRASFVTNHPPPVKETWVYHFLEGQLRVEVKDKPVKAKPKPKPAENLSTTVDVKSNYPGPLEAGEEGVVSPGDIDIGVDLAEDQNTPGMFRCARRKNFAPAPLPGPGDPAGNGSCVMA